MLKTMGYRGRDLMTMFGLEATLLGLIGAAVGVGFSILVAALVARAFFLTLPMIIDPGTVAAGVAIGVATTSIRWACPRASYSARTGIARSTPSGPCSTWSTVVSVRRRSDGC